MLHRVGAELRREFEPNRDMSVAPEFLDSFISAAKQKGYSFLSLDEVPEALRSRRARKFIAFTLDDGYLDNLEQALPVFSSHGTPFTVYVTTDFPDRRARLWWYALEDLVRQHEAIDLPDGSHWDCSGPKEKLAVFAALRNQILVGSGSDIEGGLAAIFGPGYDWRARVEREALDWDQVRRLSDNPLVTIGAHTQRHVSLATLTRDAAMAEMDGSRARISLQIGRTVDHFCYPFGGRGEADKREFDLAREAGFRTATTTRWGNLFSGHRRHLTALPRVPLSNFFSWQDYNRRSWRRFLKGPVVTA